MAKKKNNKSSVKQNNQKNMDLKSNIQTDKVEFIPLRTKNSKEDAEFQKFMINNYAQLARYIKKDLNSNQQYQYIFHKEFNKDDVMKWLANPSKYEKKLRDLSRFLYDSSSHYKRLIQYFSTILTFDYTVQPYGIKKYDKDKKTIENIKNKYIAIIEYLDVMNLKHEFLKVTERAWIDDVVYLYEYRLNDSYFLEALNPDYCAINSIEDGCLDYSFNFQYFTAYPKELDRFPEEFHQKYEAYKNDTKNKKWQEIDSSKSMCIKVNENLDYCIPPFAGIFEELYDIEDYKMLKKAKTELDNYLLLTANIPYKKDKNSSTENDFALGLDIAERYFGMMVENLPDQVGAILSPFDSVDAIKIDQSDKTSNKVMEAEESLYNSAGVSQLLFNSSGATGSTMTNSIISDETLSFKLLRQFERWVNKKLKDVNKVIKFKVSFLDITKYNQDKYVARLKEASTLGLPVKLEYCAALGKTPSEIYNTTILENDVLNIVNDWIPLSSSYTQTENDKNGRPEGDENDLTSSGQSARDNDVNNSDNRD